MASCASRALRPAAAHAQSGAHRPAERDARRTDYERVARAMHALHAFRENNELDSRPLARDRVGARHRRRVFDGERGVTPHQTRVIALPDALAGRPTMLHSISYIALLAQLAVVPTDHRADAPIPFDTTLAAPTTTNVALALEAGGTVRIVGGDAKVVRVKVTDRGRDCADCVVAVTNARDRIEVRTARTRAVGSPADLQVQIEVPMQTNVTLTSSTSRGSTAPSRGRRSSARCTSSGSPGRCCSKRSAATSRSGSRTCAGECTRTTDAFCSRTSAATCAAPRRMES